MKTTLAALGLLALCAIPALGQSTVQMQCRKMAGGGQDFIGPDESYVNGMICHEVKVAAQPAPAKPVERVAVQIPAGTSIQASLGAELDSGAVKAGDRVEMETVEDTIVNGAIAIPKGSTVMAHVEKAVGERRMGRGGKLAIVCDYATAGDDTKVPVTCDLARKGKGGYGAGSAAGAAALGLVFWPAGPLLLLKHGHSAVIPAGTVLTLDVASATAVKVAAQPAPAKPVERVAVQIPAVHG